MKLFCATLILYLVVLFVAPDKRNPIERRLDYIINEIRGLKIK
jgi:hypothetical protein